MKSFSLDMQKRGANSKEGEKERKRKEREKSREEKKKMEKRGIMWKVMMKGERD